MIVENAIHGRLKGGRAFRQDEGYYVEFVVTVACSEGRGFNGVIGHSNLVETGAEVEFGEEFGTVQFIKKFVKNRDGECVANSDVVNHSVVDAKAPGASFYRISNTGGEKGLRLGLMMPSFSI